MCYATKLCYSSDVCTANQLLGYNHSSRCGLKKAVEQASLSPETDADYSMKSAATDRAKSADP